MAAINGTTASSRRRIPGQRWLTIAVLPWSCRADLYEAHQSMGPVTHHPQSYVERGAATRGRRLSGHSTVGSETCSDIYAKGEMGPIRIGYDLKAVTEDVPEKGKQMIKKALDRAIDYWQGALKVRRATAPLRVVPSGSWYPGAFHEGEQIYGSLGDVKCFEHTFEKAFHKAIFTCKKSISSDGVQSCKDEAGDLPKCAAAWEDRTALCVDDKGYTFHPGGPGAVNEDLHLFLTIDTPLKNHRGHERHVSGGKCGQDQCDRPIFGKLTISYVPDLKEDAYVSRAVGMLAKILGFDNLLYPYFRTQEGKARVPRDVNEPASFASGKVNRWSCEPEGSPDCKAKYPDEEGRRQHADLRGIVETFNERGFDHCDCPIWGQDSGASFGAMGDTCLVSEEYPRVPSCVNRMVTPTVVKEVRDYFNCPTLKGAELNNQEWTRIDFVGSHWAGRVFYGEVSTHHMQPERFVSRVTLALLYDSGWYDVNFDYADKLTKGVHWGYKQGCDFAMNKCIDGGKPVNDRHFCTDDGNKVKCTLNRKGKGACEVKTDSDQMPPDVFKYFGSSTKRGGVDEVDYCPIVVSRDRCDALAKPVKEVLEFSGAGSRCFEGTLVQDEFEPLDIAAAPAACYGVVCAADRSSYQVEVVVGDGKKVLGTCQKEGEHLSGNEDTKSKGYIVCAPPEEICAETELRHLQGSSGAGSPSMSWKLVGGLGVAAVLVTAIAYFACGPKESDADLREGMVASGTSPAAAPAPTGSLAPAVRPPRAAPDDGLAPAVRPPKGGKDDEEKGTEMTKLAKRGRAGGD